MNKIANHLLLFQPVFQLVSSIVPNYPCLSALASLQKSLLSKPFIYFTLLQNLMYDFLIIVPSSLMIHLEHTRQCLQPHFGVSMSYLFKPLFVSLEHATPPLFLSKPYSSRSFMVTRFPLSMKLILLFGVVKDKIYYELFQRP